MKTVLRFVLIVAAFTLAVPAQGEAANWRTALKNAQRNAATALEGAFNRIAATPKQRTQIRQILARSAVQAWALRGDALGLQDQIAAVVLAAEPNEAELDRLESETVELVGRGTHLTRVAVVQAAAVLTAKQRAELLTMWRRWVRQAAGS